MNPSPPERRKLRWRRGNGGGGKLEDKTKIRRGEIINIIKLKGGKNYTEGI